MTDNDNRFEILIKNVRCDWPMLMELPVREGDVKKCSVKLLLQEGVHDAELAHIKKAIKALCAENNKKGKGKTLPSEFRCLRPGNESNEAAYQDYWTMNTSAAKDTLPRIISARDPSKLVAINADPDNKKMFDYHTSGEPKFYRGCYINAKCVFWWQNPNAEKSWPARVNSELLAAQFAGDEKPEDTPLDSNRVTDDAAMEGFGATGYEGGASSAWDDGEDEPAWDDGEDEPDDGF